MSRLRFQRRYASFAAVAVLCLLSLALVAVSSWFWLPFFAFAAFSAIGVYDLVQPRHSIRRNYPVTVAERLAERRTGVCGDDVRTVTERNDRRAHRSDKWHIGA